MRFSKNSHTKLFIYSILAIAIIVFFLHYTKVIEGFSQELQYLAPLPPNNTWSQSTIDAYTVAFKKAMPGQILSAEYLNQLQQQASEAEAIIYSKTSTWPWDGYVINNLPSTFNPTDLKRYQTFMPNRVAFIQLVAPNTVGAYKVLQQLATNSQAQGTGYANTAGTGGIACQNANTAIPYLYTYTYTDGNAKNGITVGPRSTDYSLFEQYIPNLKFTGTPYDICTSLDGLKPVQFEITGFANPEAWNIYNGTVADSTPVAPVSSAPLSSAPLSSAGSTHTNAIYQDFISLCKRAVPTA